MLEKTSPEARADVMPAKPAMHPRTRMLLEAPILPTLLKLAAPNVLVMLIQASIGLVEAYFVGKLGTVSKDVSDVILLVNENFNISATIQDPADPTKHDQGIVQGQGNTDDVKPRVLINYLPKNSTVAQHQFVVTSGLGPYFPAGLRIGEIVDVPPLAMTYKNGFGLYRQATIEPTADLNQLDELFIVLGPKQQVK